ncbi:hypothetical protein SLS58_009703 [Diplodia intermedia]|uniref:Uncharacterized protein n=1 Tax=Diplodia intermedia TaxID=856260 RepID=A0ABR3TAQ7_9PEZI
MVSLAWARSRRIVGALVSIAHLSTLISASPFSNERHAEATIERRHSGGSNPSNFIRRALHTSTLFGDHLYIDGGEIAHSWTSSSVHIQALEQNGAPVFNLPGLRSDGNSAFYLFAGEASPVAGSDAATPDVALWKFTATPSGNGA